MDNKPFKLTNFHHQLDGGLVEVPETVQTVCEHPKLAFNSHMILVEDMVDTLNHRSINYY